MNISNIDRFLLKNYNDFSLKQIQINNSTKIKNNDISLKEISTYTNAKHLALENLDAQYNLTLNEKHKEYLDEKLSKLNEIKDKILGKEKYDKKDKQKDKKIENSKENKQNNKDEKILTKEEQAIIDDIDKQISDTNGELKEVIKLGKEFMIHSEVVNEKIDVFKKFYGNEIFKKAEKEAILKQTFDVYNNPFVRKLKSAFNDIIRLENDINEKLKDQEEKEKNKKDYV